jgi:SAM-dependent methyltransferase
VSTATLRYDFAVDADRDNNTHARVLRAVGQDKRVLDVGCATGYLSEFLVRERGCDVVCLEPDPAAAAVAADRLGDRVVVGGTDLLPTFDAGSFDVVLYADVLEHLTDPAAALRETRRLLSPGGHVVVSLPNVAHADVRLLLLSGQFPYQRTGLLDSTHLRFFTRHTIPTLFARSGYWVADMVATTIPVGRTELGVDVSRVPPAVLDAVLADPSAQDYQYVMRAEPDRWTSGTRFVGTAGWQRDGLVSTWAQAFSPVEPVRLALPVGQDDASVEHAVAVVEEQCRAAGTTTDRVADIDLVQTAGGLDLPDAHVVDGGWTRARLRALALPDEDVFLP